MDRRPSPLSAFPKERPPLAEDLLAFWTDYYRGNRERQGLAGLLSQCGEAWMHRQVARDRLANPRPLSTLEIGAGTLNQLLHEPPCGPYDIVEPWTALVAGSPRRPQVRTVYSGIADVPAACRYDRITSVATLEHLTDLPTVIARAGLLLADHGSLRAAIPSEGCWLWTHGLALTTGLLFRLRTGYSYRRFMDYEHVNSAAEVEAVLRHFFRRVEIRLRGVSRALSIFQFFVCRAPDRARCREALD